MRLSLYAFCLLSCGAAFVEPVQAKYLKVYSQDGRGGGEVHISTLSQSLSKSSFLLSFKKKVKTDSFFIGQGSLVGPGGMIQEGVVIGEGVKVAENVKILGGVELADGVNIGESTILQAGVTVGLWSRVGRHSFIGSDTSIEENAHVFDGGRIASGVTIRKSAILEDGVEVGYAADIGESVRVRAWSRVSMAQRLHSAVSEPFERPRTLSKEVIKKLYMKSPLPPVTACDLMFPKIPTGDIPFYD